MPTRSNNFALETTRKREEEDDDVADVGWKAGRKGGGDEEELDGILKNSFGMNGLPISRPQEGCEGIGPALG